MLDIFKTDAFSVIALTDAINNIEFVPSRVQQLGLFRPSGVSTTGVAIEQKDGQLALVPPSPRGGPGTTFDKTKRTLLDIRIPHFEINDAVMAEEVQGIRAFGSETIVETVMGKVAERSAEAVDFFTATTEYSMIGAIKGVVTYADASTLNLYTTFGVTQITETDWDLDNANPDDGILRRTAAGVIRTLGNELGGTPYTGIHALCGDNFFDELLAHPEVRATYNGWTEAQILRDSYIGPNRPSWGIFEFGGIVWENYRGTVGGTDFVNTDKCHIFPLGVPGLFRSYYAPADYVETVNTVGRRLYQKQWTMPNDKGINLDTQMNELCICTRPRVLLQGRRT